MKRTVLINGREKGSHDRCRDIEIAVDAGCDLDAFEILYETYEHIVWAKFEGVRLDRDSFAQWSDQ